MRSAEVDFMFTRREADAWQTRWGRSPIARRSLNVSGHVAYSLAWLQGSSKGMFRNLETKAQCTIFVCLAITSLSMILCDGGDRGPNLMLLL